MPPEVDVGSLDIGFFAERIDTECSIAFTDQTLTFTIASVENAKGEERPDQGFSVLFKGGEGHRLPQGPYEITFDEVTQVTIFIVPIAEHTYEAVFTRLRD